jgi:hypothetical protein
MWRFYFSTTFDHFFSSFFSSLWVPAKCEAKSKRSEINRNEIHRNNFFLPKRNGIMQNEIKLILAKQFLGERRDKN